MFYILAFVFRMKTEWSHDCIWDVNLREQKFLNIREVHLCTVVLNLLLMFSLYRAEIFLKIDYALSQNLWAAFQKILTWILH